MATEDQLNNQRELNKALGDYTSGLTDASDFISILSSRSAELVDQYRSLGRLAKGDFTEGNKQALSAIKQVAKAARDMQNPYEKIKDLQKDIEKAERNRRQLINNIGSETQKLSSREKRDLQAIEAQRRKILGIENQQRIVEDKLGKEKISQAESFFDLQTRIKEQKEFVDELASSQIDKESEAYKQAKASLQTMEAQERAKEKKLTNLQKEFLENEKSLSKERDSLETQEQGLSVQQKMLIALQEALIAQEKGLNYLEDQENRLKNINRAQRLYNNTLGLSGRLLKRLGFQGSKIQDAIDAGSESAKDLATQLTKAGQSAVGFGGKLRIFFRGLGSFVKVLAKEIFALFLIGSLNKLIIQPFKTAFKALLSPAKKVVGEIKGYFSELVGFFMNSFFSIKGFVESFKVGEELLFKYEQATADLATNLGISTDAAEGLFTQASKVGDKLAMLPEEVLKLTEGLQQAFGTTQKFSDETVESFGILVQRLGFSNEQAADFVKLGQLQGKNAKELRDEYGLQIKSLKARENIAINENEVMKEVANASSAMVLTSRGHGTNLGIAAFNAKKLGLELSKVENIGSNLLDFESSISKEMEAELLIGRNLNLEKARQAALNNDLGTVASEISRQAGSAAEFGRMNVIQQEALAAAVGMTRNELADVLKTQELLAGTGFEDMNEAQQRYLKLVEKTGSEEKAMAIMREEGGSKEFVEQVRRASAQELEAKRQRALIAAQLEMAQAMRPVAQAFRDILQLVQDARNVMIQEMKPFFKEFGISIDDASDSLREGFLDTASKLGKKLNDIGLTLIKFGREHGPEIKQTFLAIYDVFESLYGLLGDIIKELFNIEGASNISDPLERSLDVIKSTAESVAEYIKGIDAESIATSIKTTASIIVGFYEGLKGFIKYIKENPVDVVIGATALTGITALIQGFVRRGGTPFTPLFTKEVGGVTSTGGGGFAQGTRLGRFGSRVATGMSPRMGRPVDAMGRTLVQQGGRFRVAAGQAGAGQFASVAGRGATTGTALAGLGAAAGVLAAAGFVAKGAYDVAQLDARNTEGESAKAIGGLTGAAGGAALGAAIGTMILPGVGTAIGAGIGAGVGYFGGRAVGAMGEFEDDLDKARKSLEKSSAQREALSQLRKAESELRLVESITGLENKFKTLADEAGEEVNGALELTGSELQNFAQDLLTSGQITTEQYQGAVSGIISSSDLLEIAIDNQKKKFAELETSTQAVIDKQIELAQREADDLFGPKRVLEAQMNAINTLLDDGDLKVEVLSDEQQTAISNYVENLENSNFEGFKGQVVTNYLKALDISQDETSTDEEKSGANALIKILESGGYNFKAEEAQELLQNTMNLIQGATGVNIDEEVLRKAALASLESEEMLGYGYFETALEEGAAMIGTGLQAVQKDIETNLTKNQAYTATTAANAEQMATVTGDINTQLDRLYETFSAQEAERNANNLINNILDFETEGGESLQTLLGNNVETIRGFAEGGLDKDELLAIQKFIIDLGENSNVAQKDLDSLLPQFQSLEDGVIPSRSIQRVADAASISNKGPFTIQDSAGNLAITHPNDKLVVSPNVSYVADGMSGKGGPVFPVSEDFGALDVKVGKSGVMVQKVKDGTAGDISYKEVTGTTSASQISNFDTIQQLGVAGATQENYKNLFTAQAKESQGNKYFASTLLDMVNNQLLSNFTPSGPPPAKDSFTVNYQDGKQDQISKSGELSFPATDYKLNDIENISASGNGLLALYRAVERLGKGLANKFTIGFDQERTSELIDFDTKRINDLKGTFNTIRNATSYQAVLPEQQNQTYFTNKQFVVSEGVENFIKRALYSTYYNYVPRDLRNNLKGETGSARYDELGLNPYDFSQLPEIINNIEKTPRSTTYNRYAGGGAARDIRDFFVPQYRENIIQFIKNYVSEEKAEMFRSAINPTIGEPNAWTYIFGKKEYTKADIPPANLAVKTGEYEEGSIQRIQDAVSRAERKAKKQIKQSEINPAEFKAMPVIQQEAIAKSIGIDRNELTEMLNAFKVESSPIKQSGKEKREARRQKRQDRNIELLDPIDIFEYVEENRLKIEQPMELLGVESSPIEQSGREKRQARRKERRAKREERRLNRQTRRAERREEVTPEIQFSQPLTLSLPEITSRAAITNPTIESETLQEQVRAKAKYNKLLLENLPSIQEKIALNKLQEVEELTLRKGYTQAPTHEEVYKEGKLLKYKMQDVGRNTLVRDVQTTLKDTYNLNEGFVDGLYGGGSRKYLKQYQTSQGLSSDGIVGGRTYRALFTPDEFTEYLAANPEVVRPRVTTQPEVTPSSTRIGTPLSQTPDFMLSPQGQAEKASLTYTRDGFFGEVFEETKKYYNLVTEFGTDLAQSVAEFISNPQEWLESAIGEVGGKLTATVSQIFTSAPIKEGALTLSKKTVSRLPYIGALIEGLIGGYKGYNAVQEYKNNPQSPPISELHQEFGKIGYETIGGMGGSILGGIALTPFLGPAGAIAGSFVGGILGQILGGVLADKLGSEGLGENLVNTFTSLPQKVEDGSALASKGPFTITDKFGSTAVTAKGDGVVVSPNISYVNDGITNANSIEDVTVSNIPQNTPVIENTTVDNSMLEQKVADLDATLKAFVQQMNQVVNRPVVVELDGNKVGESIGRNSYRVQ